MRSTWDRCGAWWTHECHRRLLIPVAASVAHLGIARVQCCSEPRLFLLVQITDLGSAIDPWLVYPANGIVGQFVESHGTGKHAR